MALEDPDLPAGAIVEVLPDGGAIRNDGVELGAANENPWYVLATIFGEHGEDDNFISVDEELAAKNRRAWNGWFCGALSDEERAERAKSLGLDVDDLAQLSKTEQAEVLEQFKARMGKGATPPAPTENIDFSKLYFSRYLNFEKYSFEKNSYFRSTHFAGISYFSSAKFEAATRFTEAKFLTSVPQFHAAELYDDTVFPTKDHEQGNWPEVPTEGGENPDNAMDAAEQKRAYNRLRLFMNKSLQIEEEQFFHRMEMRCKRETESRIYRPVYTVFEVLSDYGGSVMRPVVAMLLLIVLGAPLMLFHLEMGGPATGGHFWTAMGWSISNSLPFLGFGKSYLGDVIANLPGWLKYVGGFQTFFGFILLFFLGLGLRNRFRLR